MPYCTYRPVITMSLSLLMACLIPAMLYALPPAQVSCSDTEVEITTPLNEPNPEFTVLPTVRVDIPHPLNSDEQCKVTFSTEIATARESAQLYALAYALFKDDKDTKDDGVTRHRDEPEPTDCQFLPGPILSRVEPGGGGGSPAPGFDQTTTFVSILSEKQITDERADTLVPCLSIFPQGGTEQLRIRRHCVLIECGTR